MKKNHILTMAMVLFGLTTISFTAKESIILRLQPQQGKNYTIETKSSTMLMMEAEGQTMNQTQTMESRQSFVAKTVTSDRCTLETQVEALKMSISAMGMKLEYDSEHPEKASPMLAGQVDELNASLKKPATVTYDAMGNIIDSLDLEQSQLGSVIVKLPKEELSVGSTWTSEKSQEVSGTEINAKMTYTVTAISKKSIDVNITGKVDGTNDVNGSYTGTASFNPQTGLITKSSIKSNLSMTLSEQGLSIPVTMVSNTTTTLAEK